MHCKYVIEHICISLKANIYVKAVARYEYLRRTNIYIYMVYPLQIYQLVSLIPPIDAMKVLDYIK